MVSHTNLLKVQLADYTDVSLTVVIFNEVMENILGVKATSLTQTSTEDDDAYDLRKDDILDHSYKTVGKNSNAGYLLYFYIKAKFQQREYMIKASKNLQNLSEMQFTVLSVKQVNYANYQVHLRREASKANKNVNLNIV